MLPTADIVDADFAVADHSDAGYELGGHPISSTVELGRRPAFTRTDSGETSPPVPSFVEPGPSEEPSIYATTLIDAESSMIPVIPSYPPASLTSVAAIPDMAEGRNLRRFRMFAGFCALFLAGWK